MDKKVTKVKAGMKSGFDFSKFYFSKPTSVTLVTIYATILILVLSTLGLSKLITSSNQDTSVPTLPEAAPFTFLPADNTEVPMLGDTEESTPTEPTEEKPTEEKPANTASVNEADTSTASTPATRQIVVEVPKEVTKTVEVEKEVVKTVEVPKEVEKVVEKEVVVEVEKERELNYFDNYSTPEGIPYTEDTYENFPDDEVPKEDTEEKAEEAPAEEEAGEAPAE